MNPADRLLMVYTRLTATGWPPSANVATVWASVFNIPEGTSETDHEVTVGLQALRRQADLVRALLLSCAVPSDLASTAVDRFRTIASPAYLHGQWASYQANLIAADTLLSLQWASWVLRDHSEGDIAPQHHQQLLQELHNLEATLADMTMSPFLKDFIERQLIAVREALRLTTLEGARPLQKALRTVAGDYKVSEDQLKREIADAPAPVKSLMAKVSAKIKDVANVADSMVKIKKAGVEAIELGKAVTEAVGAYIDDVTKLLS